MTVVPGMVRIYANLVRNGVRTIDSLPKVYQEPVRAYLEQNP